MNRSPQVSVVMPVFNAEKYVHESISSLLAQSFHDFELVIINDGSTDGTGSVLSSMRELDGRVRVIDQPNRGLVPSLNLGCSLARGEYIARMDADDVSLPQRLELQVEYLLVNSRVALLGGAIEVMDPHGKSLYEVDYPLNNDDIRQSLSHRTCFAHSAVMMRKEVFRDVGGYREQFRQAEDYDLWLRIAERYEVANLPEVVLRHRIHLESVSLQNIDIQAISTLGSKVAAKARAITGGDPFDGASAINLQLLGEIGVRGSEIRIAVILSYLRWANALLRSGETDRGNECLARAIQAVRMELPGHGRSHDDTLAGPYYKRKELLLRFLVVLRRSLARPGSTVKAFARLACPKASLRQSQS